MVQESGGFIKQIYVVRFNPIAIPNRQATSRQVIPNCDVAEQPYATEMILWPAFLHKLFRSRLDNLKVCMKSVDRPAARWTLHPDLLIGACFEYLR